MGRPDRLADVVAALGEFSGRLGLSASHQAMLQVELDAMRAQMLWQPDPGALEESLRKVRGILAAAGDNHLAQGATQEIDAILGGR